MRIIKFYIILTLVSICQLCGQDVVLSIVKNSIYFSNNSVYFKVKIKNESNHTYVFYNLTYSDFDDSDFNDSILNVCVNSVEFHPRLMLIVKNDRKEVCRYKYPDVPPSYLDPKDITIAKKEAARLEKLSRIRYNNFNKFMVLKPDSEKVFTVSDRMSKLALKKGFYTLQLKYFSNNHFLEDFNVIVKNNAEFKDYVLYNGYLKSNTCVFNYLPLAAARSRGSKVKQTQ